MVPRRIRLQQPRFRRSTCRVSDSQREPVTRLGTTVGRGLFARLLPLGNIAFLCLRTVGMSTPGKPDPSPDNAEPIPFACVASLR